MDIARRKLSFENGGDFILETRKEVELYLASRRTRLSGHLQLYAKTVVAFAIWAASWVSLIFFQPGLVLGLLALAGLVVGTVLIAFCVQHDANHGAYFRTRRYNHLMGWTADAMLGFSSYAWRVKHNVAHHTYTNVDGYDDDLSQTPFARLMPSQAPKPWYRLQHIYIWPLYCMMVIRWQTGADIAALVRHRIGKSALRMPRRWDLAGLLGGKGIFIAWAIVAPLLVYPWWVVAAGLCRLLHGHEPRHRDDVPARALRRGGRLHLRRAARGRRSGSGRCTRSRRRSTSARATPFLTWVLGGLNYQIEHHLFPRVPHTHYPRIAEIVRRNAAKHGVRYTAQPSLWVALRSHHRHLRRLGRLGVPVEIEMG